MNYLTTEMKVKLNAKICIDISLSSNTEPTYRLSQFLPCMCNHISYFKVCAGWKVPIIPSTKRIFGKATWGFTQVIPWVDYTVDSNNLPKKIIMIIMVISSAAIQYYNIVLCVYLCPIINIFTCLIIFIGLSTRLSQRPIFP